MLNAGQISDLLYTLDPLDTSCKMNAGMEDEYNLESIHISNHLQNGIPFDVAFVQVMNYMFWDDCMSQETIDTVVHEYTSRLNQ